MTEPLRLSKRMSELGLCSRREADEWIARGWVRVDGKVVSELGTKILPTQKVTVERQAAAEQSKRVTILIHKPMGYVSGQAEDGYKPAVALVNAESRWSEDKAPTQFHPTQLRSLVPAGRLDIDSVGLLVLTQDGRIAKHLIGETTTVEKEYLVRVQYTKPGKLPDSDLKRLNHGLMLDGKKTAAGASEMAERRSAEFYFARRKKTPDSPHVRHRRSESGGTQTRAHRTRQAWRSTGWSMALSDRERTVLMAQFY